MDINLYKQAKLGLLALDLSDQTKWKITGSDRVRYLNGQTTCDVKSLNLGQSSWSAVTSIKGKLDGHLRIAALPDAFMVDTTPALTESLFTRLNKYIISDNVEFSDVTAEWKLYHLLGGSPILSTLPSYEESPHLSFASNRLGLTGVDLWLPVDSEFKLPVAEDGIWNLIRVENGIPKWGIDMNQQNLAPEMPFEQWGGLSYKKGCYIGQEVIARIKSIGHVNKQLCRLKASSQLTISLPSTCMVNGKDVGKVTSHAVCPTSQSSIFLATLLRPYISLGQVVELQGEPCVVY